MPIAAPQSRFEPLVHPPIRPIAGAFIQDQIDVDTPWHHHDMHQIQYAFDGALEVEDGHRRSLLPRQLAGWIPAGVAHRTSLHRVRSISILLAPGLVCAPGDRVRILQVSPLMRELVLYARRWPIQAPLEATGEAYFRTFGMLCSEWIRDETPLSLPTTSDPKLNSAMAYTRENLGAASLARAAETAALSERTLRRRFRAIGITWDEYRRRSRLLAAIDMLDKTAASIGQIGADVGYESQGAFTQAFQRMVGVAPSEFRRQMRRW